jgi:hypothetical protein
MTHPIYSSRKRTLAFVGAAVAPFAMAGGLLALGASEQSRALEACNAGKFERCSQVATADQDKITNPEHLQAVKEADERAARQVREESERNAKIAEAKAQADAKFKAEGWFELEPGIYGRWCTETCSTAEVIGDQAYWLMEVWAKDRAAGDVYAQINVIRNGVIIGWTNDTAYIDRGQRAVLTFGKHGIDNPSQHQAQLVKFNARG